MESNSSDTNETPIKKFQFSMPQNQQTDQSQNSSLQPNTGIRPLKPLMPLSSINRPTTKILPTKIASNPLQSNNTPTGNTRMLFNPASMPQFKLSPSPTTTTPNKTSPSNKPNRSKYQDHRLGPGFKGIENATGGGGKRYQDQRLSNPLQLPLPPGAGQGKKYQDHRGPGILPMSEIEENP